MLIALLVFEIILIGLTVFTTHMVEHKFTGIHNSLDMYCSKRAYKTKADINFIETIIMDYKRLCIDTDEEPDLPSAVSLKLHKEYIGKFTYVSIKNIAIKAKHLMWGVFAAEILIAWTNQVVGDKQTIIITTTSLLLTMMMYFYGVIKGIEEKQETLIDEVTHYIKNVYPMEQIKQNKKEQEQCKVSHIKNKDDDIEPFLKGNITREKVNTSKLSAEDIAQVLKNYSSSN